jgi:8-amino-7-oxononanoate synthase
MLDFASALYLGMRHASCSLRPWQRISAGIPAALDPPEGAPAIAPRVAMLQGCEAASMGTSTLHLVWDLFKLDGTSRSAIYLDAGAYPILGWGAERSAARGVPVRRFPHHDAGALASVLRRDRRRGLRPLVVTDGLCPSCGTVAPLREYLESAERYGGAVVVDDTQALGILGHDADPGTAYGRGGGGSLRWLGLSSSRIVVLSSMAKGFGAPLAVVSGSRQMIERFEAASETRVHCSPPSVAVLRAAERALQLNHQCGEQLRARLAALVTRFRRGLRSIGLVAGGGLFPVQTISALTGPETLALHKSLLEREIRTVLHRARRQDRVKLSFLINASHRPEEIDHAVNILSENIN